MSVITSELEVIAVRCACGHYNNVIEGLEGQIHRERQGSLYVPAEKWNYFFPVVK